MKWSVVPALCSAFYCARRPRTATIRRAAPDTTVVEPATTLPIIIEPESGAPSPRHRSCPRRCCRSPTVARVRDCLGGFVRPVIAKDYRVARYASTSTRRHDAGTTRDLIDVRYEQEVEYIDVNSDYLVGAVPQGTDRVLTSKVRRPSRCSRQRRDRPHREGIGVPPDRRPVRTLHIDGTEIDAACSRSGEDNRASRSPSPSGGGVFAIVLVWCSCAGCSRRSSPRAQRCDGEPIRRTAAWSSRLE